MATLLQIKVLRGLKFFVRSRPANFKPTPHPQEFENSCPLPPRRRLTRTHPALIPSQTCTCHCVSENH